MLGAPRFVGISAVVLAGACSSILGYDDEEQAIAIANDTEYGLGGYVHSTNIEHARKVAARIRAAPR